jgi:hypothetical protein
MHHKAVLAALLVLNLFILGGCGGKSERPPLGKVSGTVSYKGKPLTQGSVLFTPVQGRGGETGQVGVGQIESDGSFELTTFDTGDGALIGQHVVTIESRGMSSDEIKKMNLKPDGSIAYVLPKPPFPAKYSKADASPLRQTVKAEGNEFTIELKD